MQTVLVTGSTGFIGKRLIPALLEKGCRVYALVRIKGTELKVPDNPNLKYLYGDLANPETIPSFPKEIDAAYYLIHSLATTTQNLEEEEVQVAKNFLSSIEKTDCKQIIFLSGIIEDKEKLSPHLQSRLAVEEALGKGTIPLTVLRASIIIGAGSFSFEIIRDLVEKLPFMVAPKWIDSYCQPIAIGDVLFYLQGVLLNPKCYRKTFDIGGPEVFTFKELLLEYAKFRGLNRYILKVPVLTPNLSSYWLVFITSVKLGICRYLVESMKQNTRKVNAELDQILPHKCLNFEDSLKLVLQKISQNEVVSTWMDDWTPNRSVKDIEEFIEVPDQGCYKDIQRVPITIPFDTVKRNIWTLGGSHGWPSLNWAWELRGLVDKLFGGVGMNRGRRNQEQLVTGDSIDFWRVILASEDPVHLILYSEMKLPGEAWLEFSINTKNQELIQTATFRPKGVGGRLYWYSMYPFHWIIFHKMAKVIAQG